MKLIIHPKCRAHSDEAFILVNTSKFNMGWCLNHLQGIVLSEVESSDVEDLAALAYAKSRVKENDLLNFKTSERDYPQGNYFGRCLNCEKSYSGPKISRFCFKCSQPKTEPTTTEE